MRLLDIIAEYLRAADYVFKFANCDETIELFQGKKHESGPHIVNID